MTDRVRLRGFGFSGFRSFESGVIERIGPMEKVHLVAGPNNSGKSNVLQVATRVLPAFKAEQTPEFLDSDEPTDEAADAPNAFKLAVLHSVTDEKLTALTPHLAARSIRALPGFGDETDALWFDFDLVRGSWVEASSQVQAMVDATRDTTGRRAVARDSIRNAITRLAGMKGGRAATNSLADEAHLALQNLAGALNIAQLSPRWSTSTPFGRSRPLATEPTSSTAPGSSSGSLNCSIPFSRRTPKANASTTSPASSL
jgi:hypothetical protein